MPKILRLPRYLSGVEHACNTGAAGDVGSILGLEDPWRTKWQPTPVFLPGESHGQRSLAGHGVARVGHNLATKPPPPEVISYDICLCLTYFT